MIAPSPQDSAAVIARLEEAVAHIARLEQEAKTALYEEKNEDAYRRRMREKALFVAGLPEALAACLADAPADLRARIEPALNRFAHRGREALSLDSVFYMSALLYPASPVPGGPNKLELLIRTLKNSSR
ncbi:MAG: hypothetical protein LBP61_09150 [Desulfovibrio sp.]|jgi:hypothetical protein|nr:hypothetical protein [Desulfovibrio sp.]